nr:MAG TPA: hypothetical protein [Caudoviricetes sp.]
MIVNRKATMFLLWLIVYRICVNYFTFSIVLNALRLLLCQNG